MEPINIDDAFVEGLSEEMRGDEAGIAMLRESKDVNTLAQNYIATKKLVGGSIKPLSKESTPGEVEAYYARTRPETADKYELQAPGEGVKDNEALIKGFKDIAHKAGYDNRQVNAAVGFVREQSQLAAAEGAKALAEMETALKGRWGANMEPNDAIAARAITEFASEAQLDFLEDTGLGDHPILRELFHTIGEHLVEGRIPLGELPDGISNAEDALQKIQDIRNDKEHPYNKKDAAGNQAAAAEMLKLYEVAYPNQQNVIVG